MGVDEVESGLYQNSNTGAIFAVQVQGDDVVIFQKGREITRLDKFNFWFNITEATGPTYEVFSDD